MHVKATNRIWTCFSRRVCQTGIITNEKRVNCEAEFAVLEADCESPTVWELAQMPTPRSRRSSNLFVVGNGL